MDAPDEPPTGTPASPLGQVPIAVKDLFCTEGVPTTAGSRILEGHRPPYTATAVRRLAAAGAPMLGKTNMDEFAMGSSNENSGYGIVRNPWDPERVPGGSSGGSAAAVAAGLAPWAIGTDTGGSIRQPASLCGIVGLKPTYGAISRYGMVAFASSLDQCGPLTRTVTDAALLLRHMVGHDPCDSTSLGLPEEVAAAQPHGPEGAPVRRAARARLRRRGRRGRRRRGVRPHAGPHRRSSAARSWRSGLPHAPHGISAYYVIAPAEASSNLARYDGVRYGLRAGNGTLLDLYERTRAEGFGEEVKRRIMLGTFALSAGYYEAYYGRAQRVRTKIADDFRAAFAECDFVVTPDVADRRVQARRAHRRSARDVHGGLLHGSDVAGGHSRRLDPCRTGAARRRQRSSRAACRSASRSPGRPSPRTGCWTPPSRSSRRSASTPRGRSCE